MASGRDYTRGECIILFLAFTILPMLALAALAALC